MGTTPAASLRDRLDVPAASTLSLENLRNDEVSFVRATAAAWRLGHAADDNGTGGGDRGGGAVRVWLPPVRLNSTHDLAAGMSVAPECAVGDGDGDGGEAASAGPEGCGGGGGGGGSGFDAGEIQCKVRYTVMLSGVVEIESDVSMPDQWATIPRCVGMFGCNVGPSLACDVLGAPCEKKMVVGGWMISFLAARIRYRCPLRSFDLLLPLSCGSNTLSLCT